MLRAIRALTAPDGRFVVETMTVHAAVDLGVKNPHCHLDADGILWSKAAPGDVFTADMIERGGERFFPQRRLVTPEAFAREVEAAGFHIERRELVDQHDGDPNLLRIECTPR